MQHNRTKHVEVDGHFIKEKLDNGLVCILHVSTDGLLEDVLTKGLNNTRFRTIINKMEMYDIHSQA